MPLTDAERLELVELDAERARRRAREHFLSFVTATMPEFRVSWHHALMADVLEKFGRGDIKKLIITMPPRHGKTQLLSRHLPAWLFGIDPNIRILAASYAASLASSINRDVQRIITSEAYADIFPETTLNQKNIVSTAQGAYLRNSEVFEIVGRKGYYKCAGIGGSLTGSGGDRLICDDFLKDWKEAQSKTVRDSQWDWYRAVFQTRMQKGGGIALTVTRWSDDDIIGRLLSMGDAAEWTVVNLPAVQDQANPPDYDPRKLGEALWPDEFPAHVLKERRDILGERIFEALYQQRPSVGGGNIIKSEWIKTYTDAEKPARFDSVAISCDLTFKDKEKSDFCAYVVWGTKGARRYVLHLAHDRMDFIRQIATAQALHASYAPNATYVEDAANGAALVSVLRKSLPGLIPVHVDTSKVARLEAVAPLFEAGDVYFPAGAPWLGKVEAELTMFPNAAHDDICDAISLGLNRLSARNLTFEFAPVSVTKRSQWG